MTHEEVRPRLAAYAAGALDDVASAGVRDHLATGCPECLRDLYVRPVGLPRDVVAPASAEPTATQSAAAPRRRPVALLVLAMALAAALAATVGWTVVELRSRDAARREEEARTARERVAAERARAALEQRAAALDRDLADLREAAERAREPEPPSEDAGVRAELDEARSRIAALEGALRRRERELRRVGGTASDDLVRRAVAAPGVELLRLEPVAPFRDVRGHALWHPGADRILVYAYGLPPLPAGGRYRLDLEMPDGARVVGPSFAVGATGDVTVAARLDGNLARPQGLRVMLEPAGWAVLGWFAPVP